MMQRITPKTRKMQSASVLLNICCRADWTILKRLFSLQAHMAFRYATGFNVKCFTPVTSCTGPPSGTLQGYALCLTVPKAGQRIDPRMSINGLLLLRKDSEGRAHVPRPASVIAVMSSSAGFN